MFVREINTAGDGDSGSKLNSINFSNQDKRSRLPTLTEVDIQVFSIYFRQFRFIQVSNLFEEFYYYAKYYSWIQDEKTVKRTFMKLLEKFAISDINIDEASKVKNFLQKEIFTISNSANDAFIDYDIFNRYNFIVSDLIKRKSSSSTEKTVTVAPDRLITPSSVINSFDKLHNFKLTEITTRTTSTTRRPLFWKPGKTPNSQKWKKLVRYK